MVLGTLVEGGRVGNTRELPNDGGGGRGSAAPIPASERRQGVLTSLLFAALTAQRQFAGERDLQIWAAFFLLVCACLPRGEAAGKARACDPVASTLTLTLLCAPP
jgi:hypothetical protein